VAVGGVGLAGCATDAGDGASAEQSGTTAAASAGDPASQLEIEGFLTADETAGRWEAEVRVENPTSQSVTATFGAEILPSGGRRITAEQAERTIAADAEDTFRLDIADPASLSFEQLTGVLFRGFEFRVSMDGDPQPEICPEGDLSDPTETGCVYPFGIDETHVEVEYDGDWQGAMGDGGNVRSVSLASAPYGAPRGATTSYVDIDDSASIVSANAQKRDGGSGELTIRIVNQDGVYAEQSTSAQYGVAQVSADITRDSPIRERESGDVGGATGPEPTYAPTEFLSLLITHVYDDSQDQFETESDVVRNVKSFVHPERREQIELGEGLPSAQAILDDDVSFELVDTTVVEEAAPDDVLVAVVYTQGGERVERLYRLRIGPSGEWMIWDVRA
jgi:hypothetical protein